MTTEKIEGTTRALHVRKYGSTFVLSKVQKSTPLLEGFSCKSKIWSKIGSKIGWPKSGHPPDFRPDFATTHPNSGELTRF